MVTGEKGKRSAKLLRLWGAPFPFPRKQVAGKLEVGSGSATWVVIARPGPVGPATKGRALIAYPPIIDASTESSNDNSRRRISKLVKPQIAQSHARFHPHLGFQAGRKNATANLYGLYRPGLLTYSRLQHRNVKVLVVPS